jgi:hypothetical protein
MKRPDEMAHLAGSVEINKQSLIFIRITDSFMLILVPLILFNSGCEGQPGANDVGMRTSA